MPTTPPPLGSPLVPGGDHPLFASPPLPQDVPAGERAVVPHGYELQDVGPSGVGGVDIYISEDGGMKWFHYGVDADRTSPLDIVVPRDGNFGFAIRVRNGLGIVADPPQPGQPAEIGVVVDQTVPVAHLMPLQQGAVGSAYQVRISWFVQDDFLADRPSCPVSVRLCRRSLGADHRMDREPRDATSGRSAALAPRSIYVRLEARDAAGNITTATSPQPLLIDTSRPTVRILDVESAAVPSQSR